MGSGRSSPTEQIKIKARQVRINDDDSIFFSLSSLSLLFNFFFGILFFPIPLAQNNIMGGDLPKFPATKRKAQGMIDDLLHLTLLQSFKM